MPEKRRKFKLKSEFTGSYKKKECRLGFFNVWLRSATSEKKPKCES